MKDLITKLFAALPLYGRQMGALLMGPKTAILRQDLESDSTLQQALTFIAVTFGITYIVQTPFIPDAPNRELMFGMVAVQCALAVVLTVALTLMAWRIVGGKMAWRTGIVVTCYFSGVSTILFLVVELIALGAFRFLDPVLCQQVLSNTVIDPADLLHSGGYQVFVVLLAVATMVVFAWMFLTWGAYRRLMQLSRRRSAMAFFLFTTFIPFQILVHWLMWNAVIPSHGSSPVPNELIGQWQIAGQDDVNGSRVGHILTFSFAAPRLKIFPAGEYTMRGEELEATKDQCTISRTRKEYGQVIVHGSTIALTPLSRAQSTKDDCLGKSWDSPTDLSKAEYEYRIEKHPSGWTLCLSNRFGRVCLVPKMQ